MPKQGKSIDKNDPEYLEKRKRNNEAIRKSREKAKAKASETGEKVDFYKKDNKRLEDKISVLGQEMQFLKDIFLTHAGSSHGLCLDDLDVKALLREDDEDNDNENEDSNDKDDDDEDSSEIVRERERPLNPVQGGPSARGLGYVNISSISG